MGEAALAVGMPKSPAPKGWDWVALTDVARLESGHTPSRKHPEYWGGEVPWLSIRDAKAHHAGTIHDTIEHTNELGIKNSSARILPSGTVCLSRTASVGYVVVMGRPMATSQDFVNWVCSKQLEPRFLQYLLVSEGSSLSRFSSGAVHQTIYFPEVKAFHICLPSLEQQRRIVAVIDEAFAAIATASVNAEKNLANARKTRALLHRRAFAEIDVREPLGDLARFRNGINFTSASRGEEVRIVGVKDFQDHVFVPDDDLVTVQVDGTLTDEDLLRAGDILTVRSNGNKALIGRCMIAASVQERTAHSGFTIRIRADPGRIYPEYLCRFLRSPDARERLVAGGAGANISSLNQKVLASLPVPVPSAAEQRRIVEALRDLSELTGRLEGISRAKLAHLAALKQSIFHAAFSGEIVAQGQASLLSVNDNFATPEFAAQLLAFAHARHVARGCAATFGHVKAQKTLHAIEAIGGLDLGRRPIRDAAGPNDFAHMRQAENWARQRGFFEFVQRTSGGYDFRPLQNYGKLIDKAKRRVEQAGTAATHAVELLVDMDSDWAEIVVTTFAAWNNLILDSAPITDDAIVQAARDAWHAAKLRHDPSRFHDAIRFIRQNGIEPDGSAKRVGGQESLPL
jgi:type I restriction enzyme S subunit